MASAQSVEVIQDVNAAAAMLSPLRLQLLERLSEPDSASGLARELGMPRQRLNYHLRELEKAGLVELVEERRKGNCMERVVRATARSYLISPEVLGSLGETPEEARDRFSSAYMVAVLAQALKDVAVLRGRAKAAEKRLSTLTVQSEIRFANPAQRNAFAEELAGEVTRLVAKYHDESAEDGRAFRLFLGAYPKITKDK